MYSQLSKTGFWTDGSGVKDGLMKKSWFEESEVKDYKEGNLKGSTDVEKEALAKMEVASEKVMKEVRGIRYKIYAMDKNIPLTEVLTGYDPEVVYKLEKLFLK